MADEFSYFAEQITELLQSHDPKVIVEQCETIMASDHDHHGINISFFHNQIEQLKYYNHTALLLQELSYLWSWNNHSMLRVLVEFCKNYWMNLTAILIPFSQSHPIWKLLGCNNLVYYKVARSLKTPHTDLQLFHLVTRL